MSKALRELESIWGSDTCSESTNTIPELFRPLVAFLKAPERGLPVINGVSAWLKAVEHWSEAARFFNIAVQITGLPLLGTINYNQQLYRMSPR